MARHAGTSIAQVDVRIGETTLERFCVRAGEQIWIGSHPGADLAVADVGSFPLVTGEAGGFVVRLSIDGEAGEARLAPGDVLIARFGLATVEVQLAIVPRTPVPRPPFELRPAIYTVLSLIAHLCVWDAAMHAPLPVPPPKRVLARLVQHPREPPPVPPKIPPAPAPAPPRAQPSKPHEARAHRAAPRASDDDAPGPDLAAFASIPAAFPVTDLGSAFSGSAVYGLDDDSGFGDHLSNGGPGSMPVGPYASVLSDNPLRFCIDDCRTDGPIDLAKLSDDLEHAWAALTRCDYTAGPVTLTFTIDAAGHAGHIDTDGAGAECAAKVIASNQFRATTGPTDVTLSLGYK